MMKIAIELEHKKCSKDNIFGVTRSQSSPARRICLLWKRFQLEYKESLKDEIVGVTSM